MLRYMGFSINEVSFLMKRMCLYSTSCCVKNIILGSYMALKIYLKLLIPLPSQSAY